MESGFGRKVSRGDVSLNVLAGDGWVGVYGCGRCPFRRACGLEYWLGRVPREPKVGEFTKCGRLVLMTFGRGVLSFVERSSTRLGN